MVFYASTVKKYSTFICNETFIICEAALYMYYEKNYTNTYELNLGMQIWSNKTFHV